MELLRHNPKRRRITTNCTIGVSERSNASHDAGERLLQKKLLPQGGVSRELRLLRSLRVSCGLQQVLETSSSMSAAFRRTGGSCRTLTRRMNRTEPVLFIHRVRVLQNLLGSEEAVESAEMEVLLCSCWFSTPAAQTHLSSFLLLLLIT